jgi:hypothetical protein
MRRFFWILGVCLLLFGASCTEHSFGTIGPPITIPPPVQEPFFAQGPDAGTVLVQGSASLPDEERPNARVSVLNLDLGQGVIVVTGPDALYQVTIPGVEGDLVEITIEFEGELFRSEFIVAF